MLIFNNNYLRIMRNHLKICCVLNLSVIGLLTSSSCVEEATVMMSSSAKTHAQVNLLPEQLQTQECVAFMVTGIMAQFQTSTSVHITLGFSISVHVTIQTFSLLIFYTTCALFQNKLPVWKPPKSLQPICCSCIQPLTIIVFQWGAV